MVDFTSILSKRVSETEKPKPRPTGTYRAILQGMPKQKTPQVNGEERAVISFSAKIQMPGDDVDMEKLAEHGAIETWPSFPIDFWVDTPEGEYAMQQFLQNTLNIDVDSMTYGEALAQSAGKPLYVSLVHRPFTDKLGQPQIATDVKGTAAV